MLKHVVMWKLKDNADGRNKAENAILIKERLEALEGIIEELKDIEVGIGIDMPGSTWDLFLYTGFDSQADLDAYQIHPMHQEVGKIIKTAAEARQAVDYYT